MKHLLWLGLLFYTGIMLAQEASSIKVETIDSQEVPFEVIEHVPIYQGCDPQLSNLELKKCMASGITSIVTSNFNYKLANSLGLPDGVEKIFVIFKINKEGEITNIESRASHPVLEAEAIRVIRLVPKLDKPGMQRGKPVTVQYSLPLHLQIEGSNKKEKHILDKTFPVHKGCSEGLSYEDQKQCSTQKIMDFIKLSFNYDLADKLFPTEKSTQFLVEFEVNEKGKAEKINVKANHRAVAIDVIQVVKRMPKLKRAGTVNGKSTRTPFSFLMTIYFP